MNFKIKTEQGSTYLELPCSEEQIDKLCEVLGIHNNSQAVITVDSVYMDDRANTLLQNKTFNLDKINFLTKRLDSFDGKEMTTFYAVAYGEQIEDIDSLINLTFNTHCASVVKDFSDLNAIGKSMYLIEQGGVTMEELNQLNGEEYFKKVLADNPNPLVTPYGILYKNKNEFEQAYDGTHFPQYYWEENMGTVTLSKDGFAEYLYLPYVETELTKALERLCARDVSECQFTLDSTIFNDEMKNILKALPKNNQEQLDGINHIAKRIAEMGTKEIPYLNEETFENTSTEEIALETETDCCPFVRDLQGTEDSNTASPIKTDCRAFVPRCEPFRQGIGIGKIADKALKYIRRLKIDLWYLKVLYSVTAKKSKESATKRFRYFIRYVPPLASVAQRMKIPIFLMT